LKKNLGTKPVNNLELYRQMRKELGAKYKTYKEYEDSGGG